MHAFRDLPIRSKLLCLMMGTSIASLLVACVVLSLQETLSFRRWVLHEALTLAQIVGANCTAALSFDDQAAATETLSALAVAPNIVAAAVYSKEGALFAQHRRPGGGASPPAHPLQDGYDFQNRQLLLFAPIELDSERIGTVFLQSDLRAMQARLFQYAGTLGLVILIASLVAFLLSTTLQRSISEPVLRLAQVARQVSEAKDYRVRAEKYGDDELGVLIDAFNDMLAQIAARDEALRRAHDELVQHAQALQESERRFRTIYENSPGGIYRITADGRILMANPALLRMLGYSSFAELASEKLGDETSLLVSSWQRFKDLMEEQGEIKGLESTWRKRDGTSVTVRQNAVAVRGEDGAIRYYEGIAEDITDLKRAEQELRYYAMQLERSNRELQDFAYVASHDLQEPLRKIRAFGDRLAARYGNQLDDRGLDYLQRMQGEAARMQALISDLLEFSRVTTRPNPFSPVDLEKTVREVLSDLEVRLEQSGGRVEIGPLPTIEADPLQMRQLLQNLIGNALKFRRPGEPPVVTIHAEPVNRDHGEDGRCRIVVQDNGIGFEPKYADRIFNLFQRLHGQGEYEGTGMGLAICRKIVERHHGDITATGTPGRGATFEVSLPIRQSKVSEPL